LIAGEKFEENPNCEKQLFLDGQLLSENGIKYYGWTSRDSVDKWEKMKYTNWKVNEPSFDDEKKCIVLSALDDYKWSTVYCDGKVCFGCQRPGNIITDMFVDAISASVQKAMQSVIRVCLSVCWPLSNYHYFTHGGVPELEAFLALDGWSTDFYVRIVVKRRER